MAYVGILLTTILISFVVVRVGAFALQLTGIEPSVARFQALSAFTGTGFTTTEAERVVRVAARRRVVSWLIILGNAGLLAMVATLVASFTQVTGYVWFFIRLGIIIGGVFILYRLVLRSRLGTGLLQRIRRPLINRIIRDAPPVEEVLGLGVQWGAFLVTVKRGTGRVGLRVGEIENDNGTRIMAIDRPDEHIPAPPVDERVLENDRLFIYGRRSVVNTYFG
jgi:hypothetical protein